MFQCENQNSELYLIKLPLFLAGVVIFSALFVLCFALFSWVVWDAWGSLPLSGVYPRVAGLTSRPNVGGGFGLGPLADVVVSRQSPLPWVASANLFRSGCGKRLGPCIGPVCVWPRLT